MADAKRLSTPFSEKSKDYRLRSPETIHLRHRHPTSTLSPTTKSSSNTSSNAIDSGLPGIDGQSLVF